MSVDDWAKTAFGAHYSRLYRHRDVDEARRAVDLVADLVALSGADVLDLGCGSGRHLAPLAAHGARCVGMDQSPELLDEARPAAAAAGRAPLLRGDWGGTPFAAGSFDVVLSLFTAFGYGAHPSAQQSMVAEIARALRPAGRWVLDYLNPRRVRAELNVAPPPRRRDLGEFVVDERRSLSDDGRRVNKVVTITAGEGGPDLGLPDDGLSYQESVALLDLHELDDLCRDHGLTRVAAAGDYDGAPFQADESDRWILVYEKGGAA